MPEGPECRRVGEGLLQACSQKKITQIEVLGGRFLKTEPVGLASLALPAKVVGGGVKGKFIWLELDGDQTCWITLGMSGYWSTERSAHAHIKFSLNDGTDLYFIDQRRFGTLKFASRAELDKKLKSLGLDLLNDDSVTSDQFYGVISSKPNRTIVEALMDQGMCAGVGNYIKCEVLYRAKISPTRPVGSISREEFDQIFYWAKLIMRASYAQGGASIRNYRQVNGEAGDFVFEFQVYGRREDPDGYQVVREETADGRTTHWVPALQR